MSSPRRENFYARLTVSRDCPLTRALRFAHDVRRMLPRWNPRIVAAPLTTAANQSFGAFARRRELSITRHGAYTRIVLVKRS
jgi:hypothetical protein